MLTPGAVPIRDLAEVGARLEETVRSHPDGDLYETYEMVAIAILDSEHTDYPPDELRAYLAGLLCRLPCRPLKPIHVAPLIHPY
jgi:hypothetical protein